MRLTPVGPAKTTTARTVDLDRLKLPQRAWSDARPRDRAPKEHRKVRIHANKLMQHIDLGSLLAHRNFAWSKPLHQNKEKYPLQDREVN